jgi:hypothetical protein
VILQGAAFALWAAQSKLISGILIQNHSAPRLKCGGMAASLSDEGEKTERSAVVEGEEQAPKSKPTKTTAHHQQLTGAVYTAKPSI